MMRSHKTLAHFYLIGLLLCLINFLFFPNSAHAESLKSLRKEIQELKQSVQQLSEVVRAQNKRIQALEEDSLSPRGRGLGRGGGEREGPAVATPLPNPLPQGEREQTETTTRQIGPFKYSVAKRGAYKLLPDISVTGIFAGAYFDNDPGEVGHDPQRTGFNLQEIEIAFQSTIDPYVRADVYLGFTEEGVEIEEAFITTLSALPKGLQLKGGLFLLPFGRQNQKHVEQWHFINDNLVNQRLLGDEQFRELGIEASYLFPTPFFLQLELAMSQGENENNFDGKRKGDFAYTARLSGSGEVGKDLTLLGGISSSLGFNNTENGNTTWISGADLLLKYKPSASTSIEWQSEYLYRRRETELGIEHEGGLYSYLVGSWSKRWSAGLRAEYFGWPKAENTAFRLSPMVAFRPSEYFRLKLQYDYLDESGQEPNHAAFLQWIFTMGPHGAHQF